jgi:photosystem II stability/assembly factor-like uncharacterized protein
VRALLLAAVLAAAIAAGASGAAGKPFVLWVGTKVYVSADGGSWRNATPRGAIAPQTAALIDDFAFLDQRHGWLIASTCDGTGGLFRTSDGGRNWTKRRFYSHSCTGGANFSLSVLNETTAWVVQNEPTAPAATLAKTTNGGRSWKVVKDRLPDLGKITFVSAERGWLAGFRLHRTLDGGRTWSHVSLPAPSAFAGRLAYLSRPVFFGRRGFLAGEYEKRRHVIAFYRTDDGGSRWRLLATLAGSGPSPFPQFAVTAASASTVWLFTSGAKPVVSVSRDGGRHWTSNPSPLKFFAPAAISGRVAVASDFQATPYITHDGGVTWSRLLL